MKYPIWWYASIVLVLAICLYVGYKGDWSLLLFAVLGFLLGRLWSWLLR